MSNDLIFLDSPASKWELATPIGNGRSGAMLYGLIGRERIQLTEERIWSGGRLEWTQPDFYDNLNHVRELLLSGDPIEADRFAQSELEPACHRVKSQESGGELILELGGNTDAENYRRELDLASGIARISYVQNGIAHLRESFASYPDRVICSRIDGEHSLTLTYERRNNGYEYDFRAQLARMLEGEDERCCVDSVTAEIADGIGYLRISAHPTEGGKPFYILAALKSDGELSIGEHSGRVGEALSIASATRTELFIVIETEREPMLPELDYDELRERHVADHSALFGRSKLDFCEDKLADISVDKRLERLKADKNAFDPGLVAIYFNLGKYLLIASSRPGTLPANLQGVWNPYITAPWNSDYHTNINLQMNYWQAESVGLGECVLPLFDFMNDYLLESGRETAEKLYHCRGTVLHHLTDIYGYTGVADGIQWGFWQLGGAWLCFNMWEHYLYSLDLDYLKNTAYEYIHASARFFLDFMFEDENGRLLSGPANSPENTYRVKGHGLHLSLSPTMDIEIIGGLLELYIKTEELLSLDPEQADEAREAIKKLPPLRVGSKGQLMEWLEDYEENEPGHRHVSHLFALYPGNAINRSTPELFDAAKRTLELRLMHGGGHTGWSCAWLTALYARLYDSSAAKDMLYKLFTHSTLGNLLDSHPPFQIDGNFGAAAAISEMLLQSQNGYIELLPTLPDELGSGSFSGLRARGGITVSASWSDGELTSCELCCESDREVEVRFKSRRYKLELSAGVPCAVTL